MIRRTNEMNSKERELYWDLFPFATDIIELDSDNKVGIENNDIWVRIDGVQATDVEKFNVLMEEVISIAKNRNCGKVVAYPRVADAEWMNLMESFGFAKANAGEYHVYYELTI